MIKRNLSSQRHGLTGRAHALRSNSYLGAVLAAASVAAFVGCGQDDEPPAPEMDTPMLDVPDEMDSDMDLPEPPEQDMDEPRPEPEPVRGAPAPNGIELPAGISSWAVIGVADRTDNGTIRVIVGNRTAVLAVRAGNTNPWPDGSMLAHYVWADSTSEYAPAGATTPGDFGAITLMVKDSEEYADDGGWAYGVWAGPNLTPPDAADFDRACVDCHTSRVADNDFVFTRPGQLPNSAAISAARPALSDLSLPSDILDWGVVGVINRQSDDGSLRVIVGNRIAVGAARNGLDGAWPEGAMLGHFVWEADENPDAGLEEMIAPGEFRAITLMAKRGEEYAADGGWVYGVWQTAQLARDTNPEFDRACVNCHTERVSDQDFVFTVPGAVPRITVD
jgi:Cytochrome P460